jgi:hypothetical protein
MPYDVIFVAQKIVSSAMLMPSEGLHYVQFVHGLKRHRPIVSAKQKGIFSYFVLEHTIPRIYMNEK